MDGWIKIHRQIMENPLLMKGDYLSTWVYILMSVNHAETNELLAGKVVKIKPGQGIFSTPKMSSVLDIHVSKLRRILKTFENEQQIEQRTTNQGTVITVLNWDKYQQREQPNEQRVNNDCTTSEQRVNNLPIIKECKEWKNGKNGEKGKRAHGTYQNVYLSDEELQKLQSEFPDWERRVNRLSEYMQSTGKRYKDHLATIRAWARKDEERRPVSTHPWNDAQAGYEGALKKLEGLIDE